MSENQVSALVAAISADASLAEQFSALSSIDEAVVLAGQLGFTVSAEELVAAVSQAGGQEISDSELAAAAGGESYICTVNAPTRALYCGPGLV